MHFIRLKKAGGWYYAAFSPQWFSKGGELRDCFCFCIDSFIFIMLANIACLYQYTSGTKSVG